MSGRSKTKRRSAGDGALFQDARGLWTARVELPPIGGKRRQKVVRSKSKATAQQKLRELRLELDRAGDLPTSSPTVSQWLETWLQEIAAPRLKPRTLSGYESYAARYIVPTVGRYRLGKLTQAHVRAMHDHITGHLALSSTTALQAHRILVKALNDAVREGRVGRNVAALVDAPRKAVSDRRALTVDESITLLRSVANDPYGPRWALALLTGARQGECLGLTREYVDLDAGVIEFAWGLQRLPWRHGCGEASCGRQRAGSCPQRTIPIPAGQEARQVHGALHLLRPKSRRSWRRVVMPTLLREILARHIELTEPSDLLWTTDLLKPKAPAGVPVDPSLDHRAWVEALERAGLPRVPLHTARHTTSTLLYALGVPEQTRMEILGHSSATTTAGYTHVDLTMQRDAMERLGDLIDPGAFPQIEG